MIVNYIKIYKIILLKFIKNFSTIFFMDELIFYCVENTNIFLLRCFVYLVFISIIVITVNKILNIQTNKLKLFNFNIALISCGVFSIILLAFKSKIYKFEKIPNIFYNIFSIFIFIYTIILFSKVLLVNIWALNLFYNFFELPTYFRNAFISFIDFIKFISFI